MKTLILIAAIALLAHCPFIYAGGWYFEVGVYAGNTDYLIDSGAYECTQYDVFGRCVSSKKLTEEVRGPFAKAEFGYEADNGFKGTCFHLSDVTTSRDAGMKLLCGVGYKWH